MRMILLGLLISVNCFCVAAQDTAAGSAEKRVPLTEIAIALDDSGASALEATLRTTAINGAEDSPVTNVRLVVKNSSSFSFAFVSGLVTFYDGAGVRCGEGLFKADALSAGESFETDTPGIRIRCAPATWRIVANSLLPRVTPGSPAVAAATSSRSTLNLVISVDGEEHPIQLNKPMVLTVGDRQRTIVLREAP